LKNGNAVLVRRDTGEKIVVAQSDLQTQISCLLDFIHADLFAKAKQFQQQHTYSVSTYEEFKLSIEDKPGFYTVYFDGTPEDEDKIKEETKATGRCILLEESESIGQCFYTGRATNRRVIFARAY
jgi:prolyl-tRNA synthetase